MSQAPPSNAVLALRQEFDLGFTRAPRSDTDKRENMLAIRLGGDAYAVRVAEIGGLHADRHIMPLPTPVASLLGIAGFRGQIAPVYDLAALLGYARQSAPRWLVLAGSLNEPLALAFDTFECHFSAPADCIVKAAEFSASSPSTLTRLYSHDVVRTDDDDIRPIIHFPSLIEHIRRQAALSGPSRSDQS